MLLKEEIFFNEIHNTLHSTDSCAVFLFLFQQINIKTETNRDNQISVQSFLKNQQNYQIMDPWSDRKIIYQNENITYEEAYILNGTRVVSTDDIIEIIANVLTEIIQQTDQQPVQYLTNFHGKNVPNINIKQYLARIARCSHCS